MRVSYKYSLILAGLALVGSASYFGLRGKPSGTAQVSEQAPQMVRTSIAEQKTIPITVAANGYVTAINTVDVRPQIQNVVRQVHVREGQDVKANQLLFTLDERSDTSGVDKARAQLAMDKANLNDAEMVLKRNQDLLVQKFVSQAVVDSATNKVNSLRSVVQADQAMVQSSSIALGFNQIKASISGRIGAISVHPGSLAQPSGVAMVTISQLDPIAVSFSLPERELQSIRASYPNGDAPVTVQISATQQLVGKLIFIDNTADTQSGTIRMKAQFDNAKRIMWPGTYVNVRLVSRTLTDAVIIPAQSVVTGPTNKFVYLVSADNTVKMQALEVTEITNGHAAVTGLTVGSRVVIEGMQNLRSGVLVKESQTKPPATGPEVAI
ncbi:efflux RND transporter periplasmic adaptor subunit [Glaciimonas sp. Gout2]|uniref:efflux RND transporter periplasmic adaptor subunit n=1 Tax=unclassified Glaciimonas TaxID=2644401 RepID=UPI002B238AF0|nr:MULTISPECIES: efflux RND transporter periplasmic adaptor subunit [unclassified Glaciimonas]MEB0014222.1 efflux RND transporter periplasmic adaptor subunit [Glaciimonas sp. Cout2]MEB0084042.1 efflux RND transporter periplasmic adaptor subunit [Glaciimonas sp. Gout2]